jgi:ribosomal protein S3AE
MAIQLGLYQLSICCMQLMKYRIRLAAFAQRHIMNMPTNSIRKIYKLPIRNMAMERNFRCILTNFMQTESAVLHN